MHGNILVALLEPVVLLDVMQVVPPDDDSPVHLHLGDDTRKDTTTDRHLAGEGTLLVNVVALASLLIFYVDVMA